MPSKIQKASIVWMHKVMRRGQIKASGVQHGTLYERVQQKKSQSAIVAVQKLMTARMA